MTAFWVCPPEGADPWWPWSALERRAACQWWDLTHAGMAAVAALARYEGHVAELAGLAAGLAAEVDAGGVLADRLSGVPAGPAPGRERRGPMRSGWRSRRGSGNRTRGAGVP